MRLPFPVPSLRNLLKLLYPPVALLQSIKPPPFRKVLLVSQIVLVILIVSSSAAYFLILKDLPSPASLATQSVPLTTHIRDRNGQELYKIYASQNRTLVKLSDLPPYLPQAVLAIEDKSFYSHHGFSIRGTLRAAWHILTGQRLEGGSTITQQLVKTALLSSERTVKRKLRELFLSYAVEIKYSKDQILEMYLNRVGFGGSAYGIEEAAQTYFGTTASDLTLAEAALLAGLPAAPTTFSPLGAHPELAKDRQMEVLRQMASAGFIAWDSAADASAQKLVFRPLASDIRAPHFVMYVKDLLTQKYGAALIEQGGLEVTTSLDLDLQTRVEKIVAEETAKITHLHIKNGAALVTDPHTGQVLAMAGSRDYFDLTNDGNVNLTLRPRQPGSSIKPINYSLAFIRGFTPASTIEDAPVTFSVSGQPPYSPVNYDRKFHGRITLRNALAASYNVPAVKLLEVNGVSNMIHLGQSFGITTWDDPNRFGLSLTLGGGEVTMADMAVAYGVFANSGRRMDLQPILSVRDSGGRLLENFQLPTVNSQLVLDPKIAFLISDILSDNSARAPTFGARSQLFIPKSRVAVKTGTTNNLRDNWTIGYTPDFLVAAWVGNNDNSPMSYVASGVTGASPIWRQITDILLTDHPFIAFTPPEGLARLPVCGGRPDYFLPGTTPPPCPTPSVSPAPVALGPTSPPDLPAGRQGRILTGLSTSNPIPTQAIPHGRVRPTHKPRPKDIRTR